MLPPDGLPSAVCPCQPTRSLNDCDGLQEPPRGRQVADVLQYVRFSAPISSSVSASTAAPPCRITSRADRAGERVRADTRRTRPIRRTAARSSRSPAGPLSRSLRGQRSAARLDQRGRRGEVRLEAASAGEERVRHPDRRIPLPATKSRIACPDTSSPSVSTISTAPTFGFSAEPGQRRQQEAAGCSGVPVLAALGVRHRYDAVTTVRAVEPAGQLGDERAAAGAGRHQYDVVPGAGRALLAGVAEERAGLLDRRDLLAEAEGVLVQPVRIERVVLGRRLGRQSLDAAGADGGQAGRRTDVVAGREVAAGPGERGVPRRAAPRRRRSGGRRTGGPRARCAAASPAYRRTRSRCPARAGGNRSPRCRPARAARRSRRTSPWPGLR